MFITEVAVVVHEKRNHPYEYGHRDAEVSLRAQLAPHEPLDAVIDELHVRARRHVELELDSWIKQIHEDRDRAFFVSNIENDISNLKWSQSQDTLEERYATIRAKLTACRFDVGPQIARLDEEKVYAAERITERRNRDDDDAGLAF